MLMEKFLNNVTATFYRQTMFAEYEKMAYESLESGKPLTATELKTAYKDVYAKYWGPAMFIDEEEEYTWARIPHFYYNFYVYQYATGMAASEALVNCVKSEAQPAVDRYLQFLKSGKSKYSIEILKNAGVDMTAPDAITAVIKKMERLLNEMESLL